MNEEQTFRHSENFQLESGTILPGFELAYSTYGSINRNRDNVIWVCHALTANSNFLDWWPGLFGKGKLYDPEKHFIICANMLGSCYGSTGPLSENKRTGSQYFHSFPKLTNRDIVNAFDLLRYELGIEKIHTIIGGSMGGQHALEWSIKTPELFENLILIATNAQHSPWGIAFNESQRQAIAMDLTWKLNSENAGINGMKVARSIALLSYRHYDTYWNTQTEEDNDQVDKFKASTYQIYQGEKLAKRFNAFSYWTLSKAMDSHNVGRGSISTAHAMGKIQAKTLIISIDTDQLFPIKEQSLLARSIVGASHKIISSGYGHDGFLIEADQLTDKITSFYKKKAIQNISENGLTLPE